jgi:hypothetical protein
MQNYNQQNKNTATTGPKPVIINNAKKKRINFYGW